jgi:thioredoxin 1
MTSLGEKSMSHVITTLKDSAAFERELNCPLAVLILFMSPHCTACKEAVRHVAHTRERYKGRIKALIVDCSKTPRHLSVTRVPALLVHKDYALVQKIEGILELNAAAIDDVFEHYALPFSASLSAQAT